MGISLATRCAALPGRRQEGLFGVMLEILLKARLDLHLDQGPSLYEEDVNAYLGGVLVSYVDPEYLGGITGLLSHHDIDVCQAVDRAMPDKVRVYRIYKVNADDLLLTFGIFRPAREGVDLDRIRQYYACASDFQKRIYGKPTAVAEIQSKLSDCPQRYLAILAQARTGYLHFVEQVSAEHLEDFSRRIDVESR